MYLEWKTLGSKCIRKTQDAHIVTRNAASTNCF